MRNLFITLGGIALVCVALAALSFSPALLAGTYGQAQIDGFHAALGLQRGALFLIVAAAAILAIVRAASRRTLLTVLLLAHFALLIAAVAAMARGFLALRLLLPETVYYAVACGLLVRFFPSAEDHSAVICTPPREEADPSVDAPTSSSEKIS